MFGLSKNEKLLKAAEEGNLSEVKYLIETKKVDINAEFYNECTPLYMALLANQSEVVNYLMEQPNTIIPTIQIAISNGNGDIVKQLMDNDKVPVSEKDATSLLYFAKDMDKARVFNLFLEGKSADLIAKEKSNKMETIVAQSLKRLGKKSNGENFSLYNPEESLFVAAKDGDLESVKLLVEKYKVDVNAAREDGEITPLYVAMENKHKDVVNYLAQYDEALVYTVDASVARGNLPILKELVEKFNYNVNYQPTESYRTSLHDAVHHGKIKIAQYLVEKGADISAVSKFAEYNEDIRAYRVKYYRPIDLAKSDNMYQFLENCARKTGYKYAKPSEKTQLENTHYINDSGIPVQTSVRVVPDAATPVNQEQVTQIGNTPKATSKKEEGPVSVGTTDENINPMDEMKKLVCVQMIYDALSKCDEAQLQQVYETVASKMDKTAQQKMAALFKGESAGK